MARGPRDCCRAPFLAIIRIYEEPQLCAQLVEQDFLSVRLVHSVYMLLNSAHCIKYTATRQCIILFNHIPWAQSSVVCVP